MIPESHQFQTDRNGFSLVEVLVAVVVLSIGLLGVASMQAMGMRHNQSSYLRTQATYLADDIIERMRANPEEGASTAYERSFGDGVPSTSTDCTANKCGTSDLADYDLNNWLCRLGGTNISTSECTGDGLLPGGQAAITVDGDEVQVSIRWDDRDDEKTTINVNSSIRP